MRLPLSSSCLRTMRQKWSAYFIGFPSGGRLCCDSGGGEGRSPFLIEIFHRTFSIKGQLHFRFKNFSNEGEVPSPKSHSVNAPPLLSPSGRLRLFRNGLSLIVFFSFAFDTPPRAFPLLRYRQASAASRAAASPNLAFPFGESGA